MSFLPIALVCSWFSREKSLHFGKSNNNFDLIPKFQLVLKKRPLVLPESKITPAPSMLSIRLIIWYYSNLPVLEFVSTLIKTGKCPELGAVHVGIACCTALRLCELTQKKKQRKQRNKQQKPTYLMWFFHQLSFELLKQIETVWTRSVKCQGSYLNKMSRT